LPAREVGAAPEDVDTLTQVSLLADRGQLDEAAQLCETFLRENGESAAGLFLLGLVKDTQNQGEDAMKLYRKALYLEPQHVEALLHLAWLCEGQGNAAEAQQLRARANRAGERRSHTRHGEQQR
jgi:chemotaxis protein methyltransferase WspC